ncbi:hypothetical protein [Aggregatibacter actinomycetemcomitans]|uniref:hypothetical protein n=1 Tax=Aggregatibacter actinomycetemcomitans TaxID=714 RepID=UPI0011DB582C|nr:hypothetical protein [Aggregatibacter actinomycetemcomitans]TYA36026.1 hypothetical protein FXE06_10530 [Aggregatibacter actinomycetemcomitans]
MKISELELRTLNGRKVQILETKSRTGCGIGGAIIEGVGEVNAGSMSFCTGENIIKNALNLTDDVRKRTVIATRKTTTKPAPATKPKNYLMKAEALKTRKKS